MKIALIIVAIIFALLFINRYLEVKRLKEEIKRIESSRDRWEEYYRKRIDSLEKDVEFFEDRESEWEKLVSLYKQMKSNTQLTNIPQGTIEAVKYAMKKSRPDNGGNSEDFMRFQKVYEELTRK